ncbi:MAG: hypothetical protein GXP38_06590 [Chloroflexi bacterium]|nr:hypothetical protein [Chloroflexota bacterium]
MQSTSDIIIRPLHDISECRAAEVVQSTVWPGDNMLVVPAHLLLTAAHNGGVVLGAWDGDTLVGFVFGFLGARSAAADVPLSAGLKHCSHMLAVLPAYRNRHIGINLKWAQRQSVLEQGLDLITWTYDPLEARNAHLNITRLGALCRTYLPNLYGEMQDALNQGLPSDRFQVDWWVASPRVIQRQTTPPSPPDALNESDLLNPSTPDAEYGLPRPSEPRRSSFPPRPLVEIPADFQRLKRRDSGLALAWRLQTRELFTTLFAQGYQVDTFFRRTIEGRPRAFYGLRQLP